MNLLRIITIYILTAQITACANGLTHSSTDRNPSQSVELINVNKASDLNSIFNKPGWTIVGQNELASYQRVIFISDIHGHVRTMANLLAQAKLIDKNSVDENEIPKGKWIGSNALLVIVGDYLDGGPSSQQVLNFTKNLMAQAQNSSSRVLALLGNHEVRALSVKFKGLEKDTSASFRDKAEFKLAKEFLRTLPIGALIGDWLITHSGFVDASDTTTLNALVTSASDLWTEGTEDDYAQLADENGKSVACFLSRHDWWKKQNAPVKKTLSDVGVEALLVGHEPNFFGESRNKIIADSSGFFIKVDTGIKDNFADNITSGEALACSPKSGALTISECQRIQSDGTIKTLKKLQ